MVAYAHDLRRWLMAEDPGGKYNRAKERFIVARRYAKTVPQAAPVANVFEVGGDQVKMPVHQKLKSRIKLIKSPLRKGDKIVAEQVSIFLSCSARHSTSPSEEVHWLMHLGATQDVIVLRMKPRSASVARILASRMSGQCRARVELFRCRRDALI
jgi:hypothetical protein